MNAAQPLTGPRAIGTLVMGLFLSGPISLDPIFVAARWPNRRPAAISHLSGSAERSIRVESRIVLVLHAGPCAVSAQNRARFCPGWSLPGRFGAPKVPDEAAAL
jgi:hypothetical protein